MRYTLANDFHNSVCTVRANGETLGEIANEYIPYVEQTVKITLTDSQVKRARRALCGIKGCLCSGSPTRMRGPQTDLVGRKLIVLFS